MLIVGCDYPPSFQQIAWVDSDSGECSELPLSLSTGEAERFYRNLKEQGVKVCVGIEATGHSRWFERLLAELGHELWVGDAAEIKAKRVRKQKNDREDLLELLDGLTPRIATLTAAIEKQVEQHPETQRLMTHPGVGPLTALAYVLIIGSPERFRCGKQIGSYLGLIPCEDSSASRQRLGHISKQGNSLLRFLLLEAAQAATRCNPAWRREFLHLTMRRGRQMPRWHWHANLPSVCTGCGATDGTTRCHCNSVRTWGSPGPPMV
jgi:transposase